MLYGKDGGKIFKLIITLGRKIKGIKYLCIYKYIEFLRFFNSFFNY